MPLIYFIRYIWEVFIMKEDKTLEAIVKRCQGECYIGIVGPLTSTGNCCIFNNPKGLLTFSEK